MISALVAINENLGHLSDLYHSFAIKFTRVIIEDCYYACLTVQNWEERRIKVNTILALSYSLT